MHCKKCGSQIPDESVFCLKCGEKVAAEDCPIVDASYALEDTDAAEYESMNVEDVLAEDVETVASQLNTDDIDPKKNRKFSKIIIAIGAILACILIIFAIDNSRRCEADGCRTLKLDGESFCSAHFCPADYCGFAKEPGDRYCWFHVCKIDGCKQLRPTGCDYCTSHTCKAKDCENLRVDGGGWCSSHTCSIDGCLEPIMLDTKFCYDHKINIRDKLTNSSFSFSLNSAGGIVFNFSATNSTGKEIKYVRFKVYLFNAVDDPVKDEIKRTYSVDVEIIGPVKAGKKVRLSDEIIGYCDNCSKIVIEDITIIYTDGSRETGSFDYYYKKK